MDELSHWVWTIAAMGLWLLAVGFIYFIFIRRAIKAFELMTPADRAKALRTRRQILLDVYKKNPK
jgi:phosphotransferase system  glucose/maltose/N-acetylglucosamine-specific IIC component